MFCKQKLPYQGGHSDGKMKSGVGYLSRSTVSCMQWAGAESCWKMK